MVYRKRSEKIVRKGFIIISSYKIGIFADSLSTSGLGHIERCKAIRYHLSYKVLWIVSEKFTDLENSFKKDSCLYYKEIPNRIDDWKNIINRHEINFLLIDSYYLSNYLLNKLKNFIPIIFIADKKPYPNVNKVIVPHQVNSIEKNISYGLKYSVISPKYLLTKNDNIIKNKIDNKTNILVSFGALDNINITGKLLSEIILQKLLFIKNFKFTVVLGRNSPNILSIKRQISDINFINLKIQPEDFKTIMLQNDFAIGAPGISQIERMYLGLPSILIAQNNIQKPIINNLKKNKLSININGNIKNVVKNLISVNKDELNYIKNNCLKIIDGKGSIRIADIINKCVKKYEN